MAYNGTNTIHPSFNWNLAYDNYIHVALWGNDTLGDGTKFKPYRTIQKGLNITANNGNVAVGAGTYRETLSWGKVVNLYADGQAIIDLTYTSLNGNNFRSNVVGFTIRNGSLLHTTDFALQFTNCRFENTNNKMSINNSYVYTQNCTFWNHTGNLSIHNPEGAFARGCSYYNFGSITIPAYGSNIYPGLLDRCIFHTGDIYFNVAPLFDYSCFFNCRFAIAGVAAGTPQIYATILDLRVALTAKWGGDYLKNSYFEDPQFNNPTIGDLSLALNSPAKNMTFLGDYIGSTSIGKGLKADVDPLISNFDNASKVNLDIGTEGYLSLSNVNLNGYITSKPLPNLEGRNILGLPLFGEFGDRNGEYIDATPDIDWTGSYQAGDELAVGSIYWVDPAGGPITYNGAIIQPNERFPVVTDALTFTTTSTPSGFVREIIEAPTRMNIEARFTNGYNLLQPNQDILTEGHWFFVEGGETDTTRYNEVTYYGGQFIKGSGNIFTGIPVREVFKNTDMYQYYQTVGTLTCNRVGNVTTGEITKGNGDRDFDRATANGFKINSKFMQIRYTMQAKNLKP